MLGDLGVKISCLAFRLGNYFIGVVNSTAMFAIAGI